MAHKCFNCNTWIGDDRFMCISCLKHRQEDVLLFKTGQSIFDVSETNFKEEKKRWPRKRKMATTL